MVDDFDQSVKTLNSSKNIVDSYILSLLRFLYLIFLKNATITDDDDKTQNHALYLIDIEFQLFDLPA